MEEIYGECRGMSNSAASNSSSSSSSAAIDPTSSMPEEPKAAYEYYTSRIDAILAVISNKRGVIDFFRDVITNLEIDPEEPFIKAYNEQRTLFDVETDREIIELARSLEEYLRKDSAIQYALLTYLLTKDPSREPSREETEAEEAIIKWELDIQQKIYTTRSVILRILRISRTEDSEARIRELLAYYNEGKVARWIPAYIERNKSLMKTVAQLARLLQVQATSEIDNDDKEFVASDEDWLQADDIDREDHDLAESTVDETFDIIEVGSEEQEPRLITVPLHAVKQTGCDPSRGTVVEHIELSKEDIDHDCLILQSNAIRIDYMSLASEFIGNMTPFIKIPSVEVEVFELPFVNDPCISVFFQKLDIRHKMLDVLNLAKDRTNGLKILRTPAAYIDHAAETPYLSFDTPNKIPIDLSYLALYPGSKAEINVDHSNITLNIQLVTRTMGVIAETITWEKGISTADKPYYSVGKENIRDIFLGKKETDDQKILICIIFVKLLGDFLKAYLCWWLHMQGLIDASTMVLLTVDTYLATRCDLLPYCLNNVLKHVTGVIGSKTKKFYFKPNRVTESGRRVAAAAAAAAGGSRSTRSKNRNHPRRKNVQKGGGGTISKHERVHGAYLQVLYSIVDDYCKDLDEYLSASSEGDHTKIIAIRDFLRSSEYRKYLDMIDKKQPYYSYMKELSAWLPNQVIYSSDDMKTLFDTDGSSSKTYGLHSISKVFPMQGDTIEIPGRSFNNIFSTEGSAARIETNPAPKFLNILRVLAGKYKSKEAKQMLEEGGISAKMNDTFEKIIDYMTTIDTEVTHHDIIKEMFKEIIPDPISACRVYNLFLLYVTFHGYYVLSYSILEKFVAVLNANGGELPGGFDAMKEIVEGNSKAEPVIQEIYTPPTKDPTLEELLNKMKASRVEELAPMVEPVVEPVVEPEFQPPMIAAGAAGGRRTKRRGRRGQKKRKTRRLTKKERNS